jgi:2',3'-cyclic-nucleotide 2'-phosphodiesterase (5'-nucleotidase family)
MASYLEGSTPGIIVNGGHWLDDGLSLDGQPRADVPLKNQWMVQGLQQMGMAAINVGIHDITGIMSLESGPPELPLVSANIAGPGIETHIVVEHQGRRIGITGISNPGHAVIKTPGYTRSEPVQAAASVIAEMADDTDAIILLSYLAPEAARKLARSDLIDVVIDTGEHRTFDPPFRVRDTVWVRSHYQTMRLGELRLGLSDQRFDWALDRKIDLDDSLPDQADQAVLAREATKDLKALEEQLFGR